MLLDCVTILVANHLGLLDDSETIDGQMMAESARAVEGEIVEFIEAVKEARSNLIAVSNEVGMGLVPPYQSGRAFRDLLGRANQQLASAADQVLLMVAGLPWELKRPAR